MRRAGRYSPWHGRLARGLGQRGRLARAAGPLSAALALAVSAALAGPGDLTVLGPDYPRVFFFRSAESAPYRKGMTYERWEGEYGRLMGIMGKCLDEEVLGREALNPEWFTRFKRDNPRQAVLLHCNGNARDPLYATERYAPGHWIYRAATPIVADVPAEAGETVIRVKDAGDFHAEAGRYRTSKDDLAFFGRNDRSSGRRGYGGNRRRNRRNGSHRRRHRRNGRAGNAAGKISG